MTILKSHAIAAARTGRALASVLGVTPQAVSKWPAELPELYVYRLRDRKPSWYRKALKASEEQSATA